MLTRIDMQYMEAVVAINRRMRDHEIDWEQRRYEIAKDVLASPVLEQVADCFLCNIPYAKPLLPCAFYHLVFTIIAIIS